MSAITCPSCARAFTSNQALIHHLRYICQFHARSIIDFEYGRTLRNLCCGRYFTDNGLNQHLATAKIHTGCECCAVGGCMATFPKGTKALEEHQRTEHHHCGAPCERAFVSAAALQAHRESHGAHVERCAVGGCLAPFPKGTKELEEHQRTEHHYCGAPCERAFVSAAALQAHRENHGAHVERCGVGSCAAVFPRDTKGAAETHRRSAHHFCCRRYFISEKALQQHREASRNHVDQFLCVVCDAEFANGRLLAEHLCTTTTTAPPAEPSPRQVVVVSRNYCAPCERQFRSVDAYQMHMQSAVHKPAVEPLSCPLCDRHGFVAVSALVMHMESGACAGGASREMVDMAVMAADTAGVVVGTGGGAAGGFVDEAAEGSVDGDEDGGVVFTPEMSVVAPPMVTWGKDRLRCPLCPKERRRFVDEAALAQHLRSLAHEPKIYHCPVLLGGGMPEKSFVALSAVMQHLESRACGGGKRTLERAVGFLKMNLRDIGLGGVRLIAGAR